MWDLSNIEDEIQDFKHELEENNYKENEIIYDLEKFKRELQNENLYTKEMELFLENYLRFDNIMPE